MVEKDGAKLNANNDLLVDILNHKLIDNEGQSLSTIGTSSSTEICSVKVCIDGHSFT